MNCAVKMKCRRCGSEITGSFDSVDECVALHDAGWRCDECGDCAVVPIAGGEFSDAVCSEIEKISNKQR